MHFGRNELGRLRFPYKLHLFGRFYASQKVTKIGRNVFPLLDAVSLCSESMSDTEFIISCDIFNILLVYVISGNLIDSGTGMIKSVILSRVFGNSCKIAMSKRYFFIEKMQSFAGNNGYSTNSTNQAL